MWHFDRLKVACFLFGLLLLRMQQCFERFGGRFLLRRIDRHFGIDLFDIGFDLIDQALPLLCLGVGVRMLHRLPGCFAGRLMRLFFRSLLFEEVEAEWRGLLLCGGCFGLRRLHLCRLYRRFLSLRCFLFQQVESEDVALCLCRFRCIFVDGVGRIFASLFLLFLRGEQVEVDFTLLLLLPVLRFAAEDEVACLCDRCLGGCGSFRFGRSLFRNMEDEITRCLRHRGSCCCRSLRLGGCLLFEDRNIGDIEFEIGSFTGGFRHRRVERRGLCYRCGCSFGRSPLGDIEIFVELFEAEFGAFCRAVVMDFAFGDVGEALMNQLDAVDFAQSLVGVVEENLFDRDIDGYFAAVFLLYERLFVDGAAEEDVVDPGEVFEFVDIALLFDEEIGEIVVHGGEFVDIFVSQKGECLCAHSDEVKVLVV